MQAMSWHWILFPIGIMVGCLMMYYLMKQEQKKEMGEHENRQDCD